MAKGTKSGGRQAGTPNKVTREAREVFRLLLEELAPEAEDWLRAAAKRNPAKGVELLLRVAEMFVPRVPRQPPKEDEQVMVVIRDLAFEVEELTDEQLEAVATERARRGDAAGPGGVSR